MPFGESEEFQYPSRMSGPHIAVVPVGKIDAAELDSAMSRAAKVLRQPIEVRGQIRVPHGAEDTERGQARVSTLIDLLRTAVLQTGQGRMVGAEDPDAKPPPRPDAYLFTAKTDGVFAALVSAKQAAVVSVRRLREAFYRRPADPARQRSRLVKEVLRMAGRLRGIKECANPECVIAPSRSLHDLDAKAEMYCRVCAQVLFEGRIQI